METTTSLSSTALEQQLGIDSSTSAASIVELNVGGVVYATLLSTLRQEPDSKLWQWCSSQCPQSLVNTPVTPISNSNGLNDEMSQATTSSSSSPVVVPSGGAARSPLPRDTKGRLFIDRDGVQFRYILSYLRQQCCVELPANFQDFEALRREAQFYGLTRMVQQLDQLRPSSEVVAEKHRKFSDIYPGVGTSTVISVGYRGTFAFGRDGLSDVKFRKLSRILVAGRVISCREVFGETLNDSRDPDMGGDDRYSSRFYLKHSNLEQAFEMLYARGYEMIGSCASGTSSSGTADIKPGQDPEEHKWQHYNEYIFVKK